MNARARFGASAEAALIDSFNLLTNSEIRTRPTPETWDTAETTQTSPAFTHLTFITYSSALPVTRSVALWKKSLNFILKIFLLKNIIFFLLEIFFSSLRNIRVWWSVHTIQFLLSALAIYSRYNIECGDPSRLWRMHLPPFSVSEENPVEGVFAYRCVEWCASAENAHTARLLRMIGLHIHTATPECCCVVMTTRRIGSTPGIPCCLREWQLYSTLYLGPLALASSLRLHIWFWCRVRMSHMNRAFRIPLQYLISARGGNVSCASESTFSTVYCLHMYECVFSWILEFHFSCRAAEQSLGWHFNKWHLDLNLNLDIKKHILLLQTYATLRRCADCCIYSLF